MVSVLFAALPRTKRHYKTSYVTRAGFDVCPRYLKYSCFTVSCLTCHVTSASAITLFHVLFRLFVCLIVLFWGKSTLKRPLGQIIFLNITRNLPVLSLRTSCLIKNNIFNLYQEPNHIAWYEINWVALNRNETLTSYINLPPAQCWFARFIV